MIKNKIGFMGCEKDIGSTQNGHFQAYFYADFCHP